MTIEEIIKIEPRIQEMFDYAKCEAGHTLGSNWSYVYSSAKSKFKIQSLVGKFCDKEELCSSECYELVIKNLLDIIESNVIGGEENE